jgi:hypothetical protein
VSEEPKIQDCFHSLEEVKAVSMGMKLARHLCVVAPAFSLQNAVGYTKISAEFIASVRQLEYPQFQSLPKGGPYQLAPIRAELQAQILGDDPPQTGSSAPFS